MRTNELELPIDFNTPGESPKPVEGASFELTLSPGPEAPERLLLALFCIQLFRYSGQADLSVGFSIFSTDQKRRGNWTVDLGVAAGTTGKDLLREISRQTKHHGPAPDAPARAALSWVEAGLLDSARTARRDSDLHLLITSSVGGLRALFVYNAEKFKPKSIERFASHLKTLCRAANELGQPVSRLPLLPPDELQWLESVGDGRTGTVTGELVHQMVESHARIRPDAIALRYRQQAMSYRELNERANRVARHLSARGISAEDRIVLRMAPCSEAVVALLGILKAGAVYVPLDPAYPEARIQSILEDTRPALVLTRETLGEVEKASEGSSGENPEYAIRPDQTAYIYYTSGTTGRPKGAMASQANLSSYIQVARARYEFGPSDVMPAIARLSFSISMFELMTPLASGGTLVVLDREHVLDPARMTQTLSESTIFHAGPSLLKVLLPYIRGTCPDFSRFSRVRHASSGGDMIAPEVLEGLKEIFANAEVFVIYGCSEIACMGCTYPVPRDRKVEKTYVGRPFDGMTVRLFDAAGNVVPAGVVGEIHFSGGGVVKGYLGLEELTREKFVEIQGVRYYRTGDLGRFSDDGWLEILGRSDFQVKIRGMRVELAEVEYHLSRAPGVRDGVAAAKESPGGEKILVAYFTTDQTGGKAGRISAIRRYLAERLPDYMVPGAFVELEKLPLNHNMKLDRKALPALKEEDSLAQYRSPEEPPLREPVTPAEKALAGLWKRFLKIEQVGVDDRFFDLGGDSLNAVHLLMAIEKEMGVSLDGMDILRESLEVQALICTRKLEGKAELHSRRAPAQAAETLETFHFGSGLSLYGVLQKSASARRDHAVLVCPPVGVESVRSGFVIRQLARKLAAKGVPVLYFDYYGCGDSLGPSAVDSLGRWEDDIADAFAELGNRTQATRITGLGVRLGATLLCRASRRLAFSDYVLWDPVRDGAEYVAQMSAAQERYLRSKNFGRAARPSAAGPQELLGLAYSEEAARQLRGLSLALPESKKVGVLDVGLDWCDVANINQIFSDTGISKRLASLVEEAP